MAGGDPASARAGAMPFFLQPAAALLLLTLCAALSQQQALRGPRAVAGAFQLLPDGYPCSLHGAVSSHDSCASGFCNHSNLCGQGSDGSWCKSDGSWCKSDDDCSSGKCRHAHLKFQLLVLLATLALLLLFLNAKITLL